MWLLQYYNFSPLSNSWAFLSFKQSNIWGACLGDIFVRFFFFTWTVHLSFFKHVLSDASIFQWNKQSETTVREAGSRCLLICQNNSEVFSSVYWTKISIVPITVTGKAEMAEVNHEEFFLEEYWKLLDSSSSGKLSWNERNIFWRNNQKPTHPFLGIYSLKSSG